MVYDMRMALAMYCEYCKACGPEIVGNSAFATMSTHFKRESLKKTLSQLNTQYVP